MSDSSSWEYIPVLDAILQVFATIGLGALTGLLGILKPSDFVPLAIRFVHFVALPALVLKGIGIGVDFYDEANIWAYIISFLILRAISLALALLAVLFSNWRAGRSAQGLGHVAVLWLTFTWISTVIMGIPICSAVFGNPALGVKYGLLAGMSSFMFQLPVQLIFLECHAMETGSAPQVAPQRNVIEEAIKEEEEEEEEEPADPETPSESADTQLAANTTKQEEQAIDSKWWILVHADSASRIEASFKMLYRVLKNPILWGIFWGFVISLSTAGRYLDCSPPMPAEECVEGLGWIEKTLGWLGNTVSPVALFAMGLWMHGQGFQKLFSIGLTRLSFFMIVKCILVPLIMVGLAKGMDLDDQAGRAAILIASLPISLASFSLGHQYQIGEADLAANVAAGTLLMLPTILVWNLVLDKVDLYPIP